MKELASGDIVSELSLLAHSQQILYAIFGGDQDELWSKKKLQLHPSSITVLDLPLFTIYSYLKLISS